MAAAAPTGAGIPAPEARRRSGGPCPARTTRARGTTSPSALSTMVQVPPVRDPAAPARTVARPRAARPRPGATAPPPVARLTPWRGGASKGVRGGRSPVGVAPLMRVAGRGAVVVSWSCPARKPRRARRRRLASPPRPGALRCAPSVVAPVGVRSACGRWSRPLAALPPPGSPSFLLAARRRATQSVQFRKPPSPAPCRGAVPPLASVQLSCR